MGNLILNSPPFSDDKYDEFIKEVKFERCQVYSPSRHIFSYYSKGVETSPAVVFIPPMMCTPEIYYRQFFEFPYRGFRLFSVYYSIALNHNDWADALDSFLNYVEIEKAHFVGSGLGGFLIQHFASRFPSRVISLVLVNTYSDNTPYKMHRLEYATIPKLILKDSLLSDELSHVEPDNEMLDCLQFLYNKFDQITREEIVSRYDLLATPLDITKPPIEPEKVTIVTCMDITNVPQNLQTKLLKLYPGCHNALMKSGGDFPYFTRLDEFNLYLKVHLRRFHNWAPSTNFDLLINKKNVISPSANNNNNNDNNDNDKSEYATIEPENIVGAESVDMEIEKIVSAEGDEIF